MASDDLLARPQNSRTGSSSNTTNSKPRVELLDGPTRTPSRTLGGPVRPVATARTASSQRVNRAPRELLSGGARPAGRTSAMDVEMVEDEPVVVPAPVVRREMESMSINRSGAAKKEVIVRIDGLVTGTSESDVQVSGDYLHKTCHTMDNVADGLYRTTIARILSHVPHRLGRPDHRSRPTQPPIPPSPGYDLSRSRPRQQNRRRKYGLYL